MPHDVLPQPAVMIVVIVILHPHHGDGELHPRKDDAIRDPQDQHRKQAIAGVR